MAGFVVPGSNAASVPPMPPPSLAMPTSTLELSVKCQKLCDRDVLSKSDPLCVLFVVGGRGSKQWTEVGRTEMIKDTLNPEWQTKFVVDYSFEERQVVRFEVYDWDLASNRLEDHDFLGRCETTLGAIVSAQGKRFIAVLKDTIVDNGGRIFVTAEELQVNKEVLRMQLAAHKLDKKDFFGKSDPFFVVSKASSNGQFVVVHRSEVIKNNLSPAWAPFAISVRDLCNNDYERVLKVDVFDWDSDGTHDFIGSFKTDLKTLSIACVEQKKFPCINEKKASKKGYKDSGLVFLKSFSKETEVSFLDYIQSGTAMNFSVAVDFTASNGHPQDPKSLHHLAAGFQDNQYTTAIRSVGSIIEDYDTDKLFPALGFGARVPPTGQVSHEFFLNLRTDSPFCQGVDGLLQSYFTSLQQVTLYGPTNFAPVVRHVSKFAQAYQDGTQYFVLLIITDGIITDMDDTMQAVIAASIFPMSIIIVGVGNEDFSAMEALDSDDGLLRAGGRIAARDIVQFVEMRKFVGRGGAVWDKALLAKDVLAEIPRQVVGWMKMKGIKPKTTLPTPT